MKCNYKVYLDSERKPFIMSSGDLDVVMKQYVDPKHRKDVEYKIARGEKVQHVNRRQGLKIVLEHPVKRCAHKRTGNVGFLRIQLDGMKTIPQIKMAAIDKLKTSEGWHRTVVIVEANGLEYKVKCMHKGVAYTECISKCEIVSKKAL